MLAALRIAAALNDMILSMGAQPDRSLRQIDEARPRHESGACREFVSPPRTTMLPDIMNPLAARHPDLKPPAPARPPMRRRQPASHAAALPCSALCARTSLRHATGTSIGA
ncbi:hypothetical protein [Burkholderia sp. RF4-BP95]|uniref:hypothetical protein n=1 Tax=Burkholderia sp. RF4-BP95 TaxID=1637845 RepID=UPI0007C85F10|nr:hypothetical protein [Burkholderia sp. RF4-BP95]